MYKGFDLPPNPEEEATIPAYIALKEVLSMWARDRIEGAYIFNAGEGAFSLISMCARKAWLFDCGTRRGANKILRSINYVKEKIPVPTLLVISHYHKDHLSHIKALFKRLHSLPATLWIPQIDQFSMELYLRILAFGTLFIKGRTFLEDQNLNSLISRKADIAEEFRLAYPWLDVRQVGEGDSINCNECNEAKCELLAVTPPKYWYWDENHPLFTDVTFIRSVFNDRKIVSKAISAVNKYWEIATEFIKKHPKKYRSISEIPEPPKFGEDVIECLRSRPNKADDKREYHNRLLRTLLATAYLSPKSSRREAALKVSELQVALQRRKVSNWKSSIADASHLFNIVVKVVRHSNGEIKRAYLLTGDAHNRLWPKILDYSQDTRYDAVQVPHHGSEENVYHPAYEELICNQFVVSADKYRTWRHPSELLALTLLATGRPDSPHRLFCTNVHDNCEIRKEASRCWNEDVLGLKINGKGVFILLDKVRSKRATPCQNT